MPEVIVAMNVYAGDTKYEPGGISRARYDSIRPTVALLTATAYLAS